jgi:hypothetical protein
MKKIILILWSLCIYASLYAAEAIPVKITVLDSVTHEAVPYASVVLLALQDSTLQAGSTDDGGTFTFKKVNEGDSKLHITFLGYNALDTLLSLNREAKQSYTFYLSPSVTELVGITVTHTRKAYEQQYDRKVYTVTEAQKATARTVFDLLKTLPGVIVNDEDKSITYRGSAPVMQVNDMPASFLYPDLSVIPAEKVKKIELIDASNRGNGVLGGIINILLIKPNKEGIDGVLSSEGKQAERTNSFNQDHTLNLNWGTGKNVLFGNFLYSDKYSHDFNQRTGYYQNSITGKENMVQLDTAKKHNNRIMGIIGSLRFVDSLRTDYYMLGGMLSPGKSERSSYVLRGNTEYFLNTTLNEQDYVIGAGYGTVKKYRKPYKQLQWSICMDIIEEQKRNQAARYLYPNDPDMNIDVTSPVKNWGSFFDFYFNNPLQSGWNFSISESSSITTSSSYSDRWRNRVVDTLNLTRDKRISWLDNLNINLGRYVNQIRLEAGISFKHSYSTHDYTRYMVIERDTSFMLRRHFFSVCPSINFNWHVSETNDFSMKYAYSYKFPDIDNLTDYVDKRGVYNWSTGTPGLQSTGYHSFALGHVYSRDTYNFSTELIYKQSNNDIVTVGYYLLDNIRLIKPVNVGHTQDLGVVFTNWIRLSSKFSMTNSATLDYKNLDQSNLKKEADAFGLEGEKFIFTQFNYNLNMYVTWSINNRNFASLRMNYYGKSLQHYGYRKPWLGSSFNYTCKLLKNDRLKLMFGIDNLTAGLIDRVVVNNNMGTYTTTLEDPGVFCRTYKVAITWIFNKGDKGTKDIKLK